MMPGLKKKKPPKLSIANDFLIGEIPIIKYVDDNGNIQKIDVKKRHHRGHESPVVTLTYTWICLRIYWGKTHVHNWSMPIL